MGASPRRPSVARVAADAEPLNRPTPSELPVERAEHGAGAAAQHMGVDLRRPEILVTEQLLHGPDVLPGLEQMRRERMPEGVAGGRLSDAGQAARAFRGSTERCMDGNTNCHDGSRAAPGYFLASACGRRASPKPSAKS